MEAAMGTTGNKGLAKKPAYSTDHMRGLDQSMFIDLNYETPINSNGNGGAGIGNQPQQQKENQGEDQGQTPYPPYQQFNQVYMNPQMNMSMPQQPQQQLYMHPGPSNTSFVPYAGNPYQANASKQIRQRRNSGSSVNTTSTSVNKFMKKQWNKFGGGGKNSNSHGSTAFDGDGDNDGDGMDGTVEMNTVDTEISFDDLKHIRGDRIGSFGLTDSTPYIPTLKVSSSANGSKISGDQYRKLQMAQKKAMAINFSKQRDQIVQNNMAPPRSMSLQSYAGNRPPGYANYYGMTPNMPSNMQMNVPYGMSYPQQMGMGANRMPGQMPGPGFIPQQGQGPVFSGSNGPAPYGFPPMGPRSMSLQSGNSMPQNQWRDGQVNRMNQINENSQNSYGYQPNSSLPNQSNMETATAEAGSKNLEQKSKVNLSSDEASKPVEEKRAKTVNKIDFNSLSDVELDEEDTGNAYSEIKKDNTDVEEERNDKLSPLPSNSNSPVKKSVNQRVHHENTRSGVDSVVTFESFNQKDQKTQQGAMYGLKNNSTQQTVFYSATEFPNHSSSKFFEKNTDPETNSVINAADKNNSEITSNDDVNKGNSKPDENKKEAESNASQYVDISELNNTLDQMALKLTPVINQGTFENNYGSYGNQEDDILGNEQDENDNTVRYSTMTVTQPLHLTDDGESPNREKLTAKVKFPVTEDIKKQKRGEEENEREVEDNHPLVETEKYLETSSPIKDTKSEELGSPMKSNKSLIDMTINLNSKESSPLKYSSSTKIPQINFEKPIKEKLSHVDEIAGISDIGTPSKGVFYDNEPLTPMSDGSSTYFSSFTPEQYGLLNDNAKLLKELELVTTELASSVSREIMLEDNLRKSIASISNNKLTSSSEDVGDAVPVNFDLKDTKGLTVKENGEIELDTNIAHGSIQYATAITSLAKQLNKERSKRYIVEEMLLEYQQNSDLSQLQKSLLDEKKAMKELRNKYNDIVESTRLHRTEKELLEVENQALKLEIEQLERKYNNLETEIVPKLKAQIELLEERTDE